MKPYAALTTSIALVAAMVWVSPAEAAPKKFSNCTELRTVYPGGVARNASVRNKGGKLKRHHTVQPAVYKSHPKLDRDKDGIACEN